MKRPLLAVAGAAWLTIASSGCYPDRLDGVNYDAVATVFDSTASFAAATFAMSDSVVHLVPPGGTDNITRAFDAQILAAVRTNMTQRGYTEIANPNLADMAIMVGVSTTDYTTYYWDYWCGSWGYWWGYGCYYPPYWGTVTYTIGTLFVAMSDQRLNAAGDVPLIWLGVGSGVAGTGSTTTRVIGAVNQMFIQSPYVDATP